MSHLLMMSRSPKILGGGPSDRLNKDHGQGIERQGNSRIAHAFACWPDFAFAVQSPPNLLQEQTTSPVISSGNRRWSSIGIDG